MWRVPQKKKKNLFLRRNGTYQNISRNESWFGNPVIFVVALSSHLFIISRSKQYFPQLQLCCCCAGPSVADGSNVATDGEKRAVDFVWRSELSFGQRRMCDDVFLRFNWKALFRLQMLRREYSCSNVVPPRRGEQANVLPTRSTAKWHNHRTETRRPSDATSGAADDDAVPSSNRYIALVADKWSRPRRRTLAGVERPGIWLDSRFRGRIVSNSRSVCSHDSHEEGERKEGEGWMILER